MCGNWPGVAIGPGLLLAQIPGRRLLRASAHFLRELLIFELLQLSWLPPIMLLVYNSLLQI